MITGWLEKDLYTITEIRKYLETHALDVFIPWKSLNIAYLTNYYDPLHLTIPREELFALLAIMQDKALIIGCISSYCGMPGYATQPFWLDDIIHLHTDIDQIIDAFALIMKQIGLDNGRIGTETESMSWGVLKKLRAALPEAEFVSAEELMPNIRSIKTPRERELMKKAVIVGQRAMEAYMNVIRHGGTQAQAEFARAQRALEYHGEFCGGNNHIAWTGGLDENTAWYDTPARRKFKSCLDLRTYNNAPLDSPFISTHYEATYNGYICDMGWHQFIGDVPDDDDLFDFGQKKATFTEARDDFRVLRRCQREALNVIRPGMVASQAKTAVEAFIASDPEIMQHYSEYYLHSIGLEVHELPSIAAAFKKPASPDITVYYRPGIVISSEWMSSLWTIEDPFYMKDDGSWEPLAELVDIVDR